MDMKTGGLVVALAFALAAAEAYAQDKMKPATSMYEALGGKPAIAKVVDDFVTNVAGDPRINFQFAKTDIPRLKVKINEQFCAALGGGCTYTGADMKSAHTGMNVTNAQFNALAEDLYHALATNGVPYHTQNKIIALLAPMQRDIVTK